MNSSDKIFHAYKTQELVPILQSNEPRHVNTMPMTDNLTPKPIATEELENSYYVNVMIPKTLPFFIYNIATVFLAAYLKDILEDKDYIILTDDKEEIDILDSYGSTLLYDLSIAANFGLNATLLKSSKRLTDSLHDSQNDGVLQHNLFALDTTGALLYFEQQDESAAVAIVLQRWKASFRPVLCQLRDQIKDLAKYWQYNSDYTPYIHAYRYQNFLYAMGFSDIPLRTTQYMRNCQLPDISDKNTWLLHEGTFNAYPKAVELDKKREDYLVLTNIVSEHIDDLFQDPKQTLQIFDKASAAAPTYLEQLRQTHLKQHNNIKAYAGLRSLMHEIGVDNIIHAFNCGVPASDIF